MSILVSAFVPRLGKELLSAISARFNDYGMQCAFHPKFELNPAKDSGVIPVCLRVPNMPQYQNMDMFSGFDISFKDFRYTGPIAVTPVANEKLKPCTQQVIVRTFASPTSAFRAGMYFAGLLADVTDGVVYTPRTDKYTECPRALEQLAQDVVAYENELAPQDWSIIPFRGWP